jgi:hypothetical protein
VEVSTRSGVIAISAGVFLALFDGFIWLFLPLFVVSAHREPEFAHHFSERWGMFLTIGLPAPFVLGAAAGFSALKSSKLAVVLAGLSVLLAALPGIASWFA